MYKVRQSEFPEKAAPMEGTTGAPAAVSASADALLSGADLDAVLSRMRTMGGDDPVLGSIVREHLATGGKMLRARLALAAAEALGTTREAVIAWAAAVEMLHNATLVHDDVQDGDRVRRGLPTVWARHGVPQAINAGDLMLMLPYRLVGQVPVPDAQRWQLCRALAEAAEATVRGQALELALCGDEWPSVADYRAVCEGKTGALFALPVVGAAIAAGETAEMAEGLARVFAEAGVFFQMQDDVLDLYGDKGRDRRACDLYEGKISALVVAHIEAFPEERAALLGLLRTPREETRAQDVEVWVRRFSESGTLDRVLGWMRQSRVRMESDSGAMRHRGLGQLLEELLRTFERPIAHVVMTGPEPQWSVA